MNLLGGGLGKISRISLNLSGVVSNMASYPRSIAWTTNTQSFPAGTVPGQFKVEITGGATGTVIAPVITPSSPALFPAVPALLPADPDYTATVTLLNGAGAPLGTPKTVTFRVQDPVMVSVPNTVTVT